MSIELQYWEKPESIKRLNGYINYLIDSSHYLEAAHFHDLLDTLKPQDVNSIKLGFKVAVLNLNNDKAAYYHEKLFKLRKHKNDLIFFDLFLYCSNNNTQKIVENLNYVLNYDWDDDFYWDVITESVLKIKNIEVIKKYLQKLKKLDKIPSDGLAKRLKKNILPNMLDILVNFHNEQISYN